MGMLLGTWTCGRTLGLPIQSLHALDKGTEKETKTPGFRLIGSTPATRPSWRTEWSTSATNDQFLLQYGGLKQGPMDLRL